MRVLLFAAFVFGLVGVLLMSEQQKTMHQIIAVQKQQLALCNVPKFPAMNCQHHMDNIAADQSVTESCIRMTYRDLAVR